MTRPSWMITMLAGALLISSCARNAPWRIDEPADCTQESCNSTILEQHPHFDLAYVEFSERGNVFSRPRLLQVFEHVDQLARSPGGVTTVVFVHGWKHNGSDDDDNVKAFRRVLHAATHEREFREELLGSRRLVGVYVGWRGVSIDLPLLREATYWDRKSAAQEIGKGGVTELLLRLRHTTLGAAQATQADALPRNSFLIVGHSFGGAIVLSALNEVLLQQLITARPHAMSGEDCPGNRQLPCVKAEPFAHGVVLLNPAIEANQALQLKEMSTRYRYPHEQIKLMHVISTDGDTATSIAFPLGQSFGVGLFWRQTDLQRTFDDKPIELREEDLDSTTVGNFIPFRTGRFERAKDGSWSYQRCRETLCGLEAAEHDSLIPAAENNPLVFISTNKGFMKDHNDVFNCNVAAYLSTIVLDAQFRTVAARNLPAPAGGSACSVPFDFGACFNQMRATLNQVNPDIDSRFPIDDYAFCP